MQKNLSQEQMLNDLRLLIESYGSLRDAGMALNFSASYLSIVLRGKVRPSKKLAKLAGWEPVVGWERITQEAYK